MYMPRRIRIAIVSFAAWVWVTGVAQGQSGYVPGVTFQKDNPNYPPRNPFYFEGRVDWNLLKIDQPSNAWEFEQRGMHKQDDLEDNAGAIADYRQAIAMNNLDNGTCQLVTTAAQANSGAQLTPPPCMFTVRLRLAVLLSGAESDQAIALYNQVLAIDPLRLGVHASIAEVYVHEAETALNAGDIPGLYAQAIGEFKAELALSPVKALEVQLTGDEANSAHVHWALAEIYEKLSQPADEMRELDLYLKATKYHSDTYPWRIRLAQKKMEKAQAVEEAAKPAQDNN